jgi:hypothetical protein
MLVGVGASEIRIRAERRLGLGGGSQGMVKNQMGKYTHLEKRLKTPVGGHTPPHTDHAFR